MKRILALILCFVMVFSLVAVAEETEATPVATTEFSDVPATSPYKEAISTLTGLGIILGDAGSDTFRPEAGITRAEFCVIVARLKKMGALNVIAETPFTDVTTALCDEWKVKAVRIASDLGIVAGMGDGTFAPDAPVTYEQAVKMLVCLLKYEPMAKANGGWPAGYIAAGTQIGLTKKAIAIGTEPAPRQIIAQLVYNALDIPEMNTTTEGVQEGGGTILDNNLKYTEKKGIVTATSEVSLTENSYIRPGQVQIDYDKIYNVGSSNADKYFGKEITFYYSEDDDDYTIQSCKPTNSNEEHIFNPDQIKHLGQSEIEIYTDEDQDDYDTYSVDSSVKLIYNNYLAPYVDSSPNYINDTYKPFDGSMKLLDNNSDNVIDIIIIKDAKPFVISGINSSNDELIIYDVYNPAVSLDLTESSNTFIKITKGNSTVSPSSLSKNNVLLVAKSLNTKGKKYIDIEIVSNTKTGLISSLNTSDQMITIGSSEYKVSDICWNKYKDSFSRGTSVTVYLDSQNCVIYVIANAASADSFKYGYLIGVEQPKDSGLASESLRALIFTTNGSSASYKLASTVNINNNNETNITKIQELLKYNATLNINKDTNAKTTEYSQLIKYSLNAKGEIAKILTATTPSATVSPSTNLVLDVATTVDSTYRSSTKMFGNSIRIDSKTKIFFVPTTRSATDDYFCGQLSSGIPADQEKYTFEAYDKENGVAKLVLIFGDATIAETKVKAPMIVVSKIQPMSNADGDYHELTGYTPSGASKVYVTEDLATLDGVEVGDVLKLNVTYDGKTIKKALKLFSSYNCQDKLLFSYNDTNNFKRFAATNGPSITSAVYNIDKLNSEFCMMYGTVIEKYDGSMDIALADVVETDGVISLDNSAPVPVIFTSSTKFFKYSSNNSKLTEAVETNILGFTDTMKGASKVLTYSEQGSAKFVLIIADK